MTTLEAPPVVESPDGAAQSLSAPASIPYGTLNFIDYSVANVGTASGSGSLVMNIQRVTDGGCYQTGAGGSNESRSISLEPDATLSSETFTKFPNYALDPGVYSVELCVDLDGDTNDANNCRSQAAFTVECPSENEDDFATGHDAGPRANPILVEENFKPGYNNPPDRSDGSGVLESEDAADCYGVQLNPSALIGYGLSVWQVETPDDTVTGAWTMYYPDGSLVVSDPVNFLGGWDMGTRGSSGLGGGVKLGPSDPSGRYVFCLERTPGLPRFEYNLFFDISDIGTL